MKNLVVLACACLLFSSCATTQQAAGVQPAPGPQMIELINATCFEVVVEKPTKDSLSYEKPLNWDLVDYATRNDKYVPLGTAFAISADELVTAAHVLTLTSNSLVWAKRFIREKSSEGGKPVERVYEVDDIRAFDNSRDYVVFTVKGRKFDQWLKLAPDFTLNTTVYSAGSAFGEGIVVRGGSLLDTVPEAENGAWKYLKSSVATNPGNSGGPLLNERSEVIGIVQARKDDFCYSLPVREVVPGTGRVHSKVVFRFAVFRKEKSSTLDADFVLPMKYGQLIQGCFEKYMRFYNNSMDGLLAENRADLFPRGVNSERALFESVPSRFPQVFLQETATGLWFETRLEGSRADIGRNGSVSSAKIYKDAGVWLLTLDAPEDLSVRRLVEDPRLAMDTLLRGINITGKMTESDQGVRITSFGAPIQTLLHTDAHMRAWQVNVYLLEYSDQVVITCSTPTPRGLSMLYMETNSAQKDVWLYDIRKLCDFVNVSYCGTLEQWTAFLKNPQYRFAAMQGVSISFKEHASLDIDTESLSATIPEGLISITKNTFLGLWCSVFLRNGSAVFGVRQAEVHSRDADGTFYSLYRWSKPTENLPTEMWDEWKVVLDSGHPYSGKAYTAGATTCLGSLHPAFMAGGKSAVSGDFAYTLFVSKEGTASEQEMMQYSRDLSKGMRIKE